ncbi:MAG: hypothetical protein WDZ79_01650 [Candidatus Paceibacterota bacterium]
MIDQLLSYIATEYGQAAGTVAEILIDTSYIWIPVVLMIGFWQVWMQYIHAAFISRQDPVLLEIRIPREVSRTPAAMELVFNTLYQKSQPQSFAEAFWDGKVPGWFSLELVSIGGYVHLYIWSWRKFKNMIESQLYAQYPSVEVVEVEDYATKVTNDPKEFNMVGFQWTFSKPVSYPIKTYVDYGLDKKADKEEQKDDPLTSVLELLGSLKPQEQLWIQIVIQAHKKTGIKDGYVFTRPDWREGAKKEIQKIRDEYAIDKEKGLYMPITEADNDLLKAIQRSINKQAFDAVFRTLYITEAGHFDAGTISGLLGVMQQFNANNMNGLKINWKTDFNHPWKDIRGIRQRANERQYLDAWRRRSYFSEPYKYFKQKPITLTTEELATLFHIPGSVAQTPTLNRVASRKGEAPSNIPVE